jgi:predicted PurR-regulated permease PerM
VIEQREVTVPRSWLWAAGVVAAGWLLWKLRELVTPLLIAFAIAYLLNPIVKRLERWRVPRALGVTLTVLGFVAIVALFVLLIVPSVVAESAAVIQALPGQFKALMARVDPLLVRWGVKVPHTATEAFDWIRNHSGATGSMLKPAGDLLGSIMGGTFGALGAFVGALIVPIFAIYLLSDFDSMLRGTEALIPPRWRKQVVDLAREIDEILSQFLRGQLTVMGILAVLYSGAYAVLGVPLAVPIGVVAGLINFIPYVGSAFALIAGLIMSLLGGGSVGQLLGVAAAYAVVQTLEGFVITPRIMGKSVGLNEIWVLLALYVGGDLFGFLGVLLALPVAAVLKILVGRAVSSYTHSELFLAGAPIASDLRVPSLSVRPPAPPDLGPPGELPDLDPPPPSSVGPSTLGPSRGEPDR